MIALIIIGREITISALREWMAQLGASASVAVHWLGKFKTASQMIAIPCLLYHRDVLGLPIAYIGKILIIIAAILTVWSMLYYLRRAWPVIREKTH
jgi:CDP-diacylglycerol--glycerol-3-phosphate 3-phosphatidyltransferase/cardiolipin synthase